MAGIVSDRATLYPFKVEGGKPWYLLLRCAPRSPRPGAWESVSATPENDEGTARAAIRALLDLTSLQPVRLWSVDQVETEYDSGADAVRVIPCFAALVSGEPRLGTLHDASRWYSATEASNALRAAPRRASLDAVHREIGSTVAAGAEPDARLKLV